MTVVPAYCLDWHVTTSDAFRKLVVEPLTPYAQVQLIGWDGQQMPEEDEAFPDDIPRIFCQLWPSVEWLTTKKRKALWIPMGDFTFYPPEFWAPYPKSLRLITFSRFVETQTAVSGMRSLSLRYFTDPASYRLADWSQGRVLFYWNRRGIIGPEFLKRMCNVLRIDRLIFRPEVDPGFSNALTYRLPSRIGETLVEEQEGFIPSHQYRELLERTNIFLAPRMFEGVGLAYLEALARGCAVFAHNGPTMNEYITHRTNGYLLSSATSSQSGIGHRLHRLVSRLPISTRSRLSDHPVTLRQNWDIIAGLDLEKLGNAARHQHISGYERWQYDRKAYAQFVLDW